MGVFPASKSELFGIRSPCKVTNKNDLTQTKTQLWLDKVVNAREICSSDKIEKMS
jgi:hypothetical protein